MAKMRVLGGGIDVGDYITTNKPTDTWWKVLAVRTEPQPAGHVGFTYQFDVVNKGGYHRTLTDVPGVGRRWYKWVAATDVITVRRERKPLESRPGPQARWLYSYRIADGRWIEYGTHLASLRGMLRERFAAFRVVELWKVN